MSLLLAFCSLFYLPSLFHISLSNAMLHLCSASLYCKSSWQKVFEKKAQTHERSSESLTQQIATNCCNMILSTRPVGRAVPLPYTPTATSTQPNEQDSDPFALRHASQWHQSPLQARRRAYVEKQRGTSYVISKITTVSGANANVAITNEPAAPPQNDAERNPASTPAPLPRPQK